MVIGMVAVAAIGFTVAFFNDEETSTGNTFTAGSIDLKVDLQCPGCNYMSERDLLGDAPAFFNECDIKPGDTKEVTISWHVYTNDAWGRIKLTEAYSYENKCTQPEKDEAGDDSCGDDNVGLGLGELDENLLFTFWLDQGTTAGWQCPKDTPRCEADPQEGDNILNGVETTLFKDKSAASFSTDWYVIPEPILTSNTYYFGLQWHVNGAVDNIIQSDSFMGKIVMEVVQSRNNPWNPTPQF